jgi:hypothetical protein
MTRTYAELMVSRAFYDRVHDQLLDVGYEHCFDSRDPVNGPIDMTGIALVPPPRKPSLRERLRAFCRPRRETRAEELYGKED